MKYDAERWSDAIESYKKYKCFNSVNYEFKEDEGLIYYKVDENNKIKITADILTNVGAIEKIVNMIKGHLTDEDYKILQAFYRVSYTIGNCCPVWKNPSSGREEFNDTIWYKLNKYIVEKRKQKSNPIKLRDRIKNKDFNKIRERYSEEIFSIFNSDISWEELISNLYLQDYFNYDWNLLDEKFIFVKNIEEKDFLEFVKIITVLIVQRSYRIITGYKGNLLRKQDKEIIEDILNTIGLENTKFIYSKKKKDLINFSIIH